MTPPRPLILAALLAALLAGAGPARADDDDHRDLREAVRSGKIVPLRTILERVERDHAGDLLEAELEREDGHLVYEIKLLMQGGAVRKFEYDAATGQPLERRR